MKYYAALVLMLATTAYAADDDKTSSGTLKKKGKSVQSKYQYQCQWCSSTMLTHDDVECRRKKELKIIEAWIRKQVQG